MPLYKPSPGDPMFSAHAREHALFSEANKPTAGLGVTIRRSIAGSIISMSPGLRFASLVGSMVDSSGGGATDGDERYGRVVWNEISHRLQQYTEVYSASTNTWVESDDPELVNAAVSHSSQHV